jgi:hypothetical protein
MIECHNGTMVLSFGPYDVRRRADGITDFTGTGRPVVRITAHSDQLESLVYDFIRWFETISHVYDKEAG